MIQPINSLNFGKKCTKPCFKGEINEEKTQEKPNKKELTGLNKPRAFFANFDRFKEGTKAYSAGIPSAISNGLVAGAAVYGISDLAIKTAKFGKEGNFVETFLKPYGTAIGNAFKGAGKFIAGLFKKDKTFGQAVKDIVLLPFKSAANYIKSIAKNPSHRGVKILALGAFLIAAGAKIVQTKMNLNEKLSGIDHKYRIKHKTAIPPEEK